MSGGMSGGSSDSPRGREFQPITYYVPITDQYQVRPTHPPSLTRPTHPPTHPPTQFCGSYHALEGGLTAWALEAMTGDRVYRFSRITPKKRERLGSVLLRLPITQSIISYHSYVRSVSCSWADAPNTRSTSRKLPPSPVS